MMNIPQSVKLCTWVLKIKEQPKNLEDKEQEKQGQVVWGLCSESTEGVDIWQREENLSSKERVLLDLLNFGCESREQIHSACQVIDIFSRVR